MFLDVFEKLLFMKLKNMKMEKTLMQNGDPCSRTSVFIGWANWENGPVLERGTCENAYTLENYTLEKCYTGHNFFFKSMNLYSSFVNLV